MRIITIYYLDFLSFLDSNPGRKSTGSHSEAATLLGARSNGISINIDEYCFCDWGDIRERIGLRLAYESGFEKLSKEDSRSRFVN